MSKKQTYSKAIKEYAKDISEAVNFINSIAEETGETNETRMDRSAVAVALIGNLLDAIKTTKDTKEAAKQMRESTKTISKQLDLLLNDDTINKNEYSHKLLFGAIQGVNQAFHLYAIDHKKIDKILIEDTINVLSSGQNVYQISFELNKFARTKQNWAGK